jgi:hypothetical protein
MAISGAALDREAMARARELVQPPAPKTRMWPALAAAFALAVSALIFATAMLAEPPLTSEHPAQARSVE